MIHQTREDRIDELLSDYAFHPDICDLLEHNGVDLAHVIEDLCDVAQGNLAPDAPLSIDTFAKDLLHRYLTIAMDNEDERAGVEHAERDIEDRMTRNRIPSDADRLTRRDCDR